MEDRVHILGANLVQAARPNTLNVDNRQYGFIYLV